MSLQKMIKLLHGSIGTALIQQGKMLTERQLIFSVLLMGKWLSIGEQKHGLLNIFKTMRLHEETPRGATNLFLGTGLVSSFLKMIEVFYLILQIPIAQRVAEIPAHTQQHVVGLKMTPFEKTLRIHEHTSSTTLLVSVVE